MLLRDVYDEIAGWEERVFRTWGYHTLLDRFAEVSDENAEKIVHGTRERNPIREKAFRILLHEIMPRHMQTEDVAGGRDPLPGVTPAVAEGIVQAAELNLIPSDEWINSNFPNLWPTILAIAQDYTTP